MVETRHSTVTFRLPFTLPGLDRHYPAGTYRVETDAEQLDVRFPASRRIATRIMLVAGPMTQAWTVDPAELEAALANDQAGRA